MGKQLPSADGTEDVVGRSLGHEKHPQLPRAEDAKELFAPHLPFDNQTQLRRVYLQLAMRFHPDKRPRRERAQATKLFQAIGEAYQELLNPTKLPPPSARIVKTQTATVAERGDLDELRRLLEQDPSRANEYDDIGITPLMFAARGGCVAAAELLLAHDADLHARNLVGWSALLFAALGDREEMVRYLLARGAQLREEDLVLTAYRGSAGGLTALLEKVESGSADVRGRHGKTLLHFACDGMMSIPRGNPERFLACIELLLRKGCFIDAVDDKMGQTCLQSYVSDGEWQAQHYEESAPHMALVELLCAHGASPLAKDKHGHSAMSIAAAMGLERLRAVLLKYEVRHQHDQPMSAL